MKNYDPGRITVVFRGILLQGYMDGTFLTAERTEDAFAMHVGAGGDVTRVRSRDKTGTVTVTLVQSAPTNDLLSAVADEDELFGTGYGALIVKDLNGTTVLEAPTAWIRKQPTSEFGDAASGREWAFDCAQLFMNTGGATV